jgi:hypothetical protein
MTTEEIEKIRAEWAHWRGLQNDSPVLTIQRLLAEVDRLRAKLGMQKRQAKN